LNYYNYIIEKPFSGSLKKFILSGPLNLNISNETLYSKYKKPIIKISELTKEKQRYSYNTFIQPFRKDYKDITFIDIENLGGFNIPASQRFITCITLGFMNGMVVQLKASNELEEEDLLRKTFKVISNFIVTGWNIKYDIETLYARYQIHFGVLPSLYNPVIDYLSLYRHYVRDRERSYKLDYILKKHGLEGKITYKESNLDILYKTNKQLYYSYNKQDVLQLIKLENKLKLFKLCKSIIDITKCQWQDIIFNLRIIDSYIYHYLRNMGYTFIDKEYKTEDGKQDTYKGAFCKEPLPGLYKNVRCYDFSSLYPNLILTFNISPETFVGMNIEGDYHRASNGACFDKYIRGFIPEMLLEILEKRKELKNKGDRAGEQAYKRIANSFYGVIGSKYFRFYNKNIAQAITLSGQSLIKEVANKIERKLKGVKVIYGDTDSVFLDRGNHEPGKILKTINDDIVFSWTLFDVKGISGYLKVKDEYGTDIIGMWGKIKKKYILYKGNELIIKGFEKSDTIPIAISIFKTIAKLIIKNKINMESFMNIKKHLNDIFDKDLSNGNIVGWLKPFTINKDIKEYKNKQQWMEGLELLNKIYPNNIKVSKGYIIELTKPPLGLRARKRVNTSLAIPVELVDKIPSILELLPEYYTINKKKHLEYIYKLIDWYKPILQKMK